MDDLLKEQAKILCDGNAIRAQNVVKSCLRPVILKVELPPSYEELNLKDDSPETQLRREDLKDFITQWKSKNPGNFESKKEGRFRKEFQQFCEEQSSLASNDLLQDAYPEFNNPDEDSFVHKAKIRGVVLRTSANYVSVITLDGSEELLLRVNRGFVGLGIKVRSGDVIDVVNPKRTSKRQDLDPELVCCYHVNPQDVCTFLDNLMKGDDPCRMLEDYLRSVAVWTYILNVSVNEECQQQGEICQKVLEVCQKISNISSSTAMAGTIRNFWTSFDSSKSFNDVLLKLVKDDGAWQLQQGNTDLVKNFIENLLRHLPECGVRAIEIVKNLKVQSTGMEFMEKLLSILALNVTGVKDNPKHLKWNQQAIIPVSRELLTAATHWKDLPSIKVADNNGSGAVYVSEEEYIMTYYTLMREECFHKLKNGIGHFLLTGSFDPKDIMMYRVHLLKVVPTVIPSIQDGLTLVFEFKTKKSNESDDPDNSKWLMFGNLLCLSLDATFQCPIWGIIIKQPESTKEDTQVHVSLCSEQNKLSEAEVIMKLQQLEDQGIRAYMVESNTFYRAYGPPMEVLQQKETVPFKEQLVDVKKCTGEPPDYLKNLLKHPDWTIIFDNPSCVELHDNGHYSYELLIQEFKELRRNPESKSKLDDKQLDAVEQALCNKVTLIQGPPGTGKSYVGEALLQLLLSMEVPDDNGPILVVTYKNYALDNFLDTCLKKIPNLSEKITRVGRGSDDASEELKQRNIYEIIKRSERDNDYQMSQKLKMKLEEMKPKIDKCVSTLRSSNQFTASVFIKEAEAQHFKDLFTKHEDVEKINEILNDKDFKGKHFEDVNNSDFLKTTLYTGTITQHHQQMCCNVTNIFGAELSKMIEEPLKNWLPKQEKFEQFAGKVIKSGLEEHSYNSSLFLRSGTKEESKEEDCNTRQSQPCEDREERVGDVDQDEVEKENTVDQTTSEQVEEALIVLPEIPDEKLGNVKSILNAGNIQELEEHERIQMVYALQRQRYKSVSTDLLQLTKDFTEKQQRKKELRDQLHIKTLKSHSIIGMTVSGAAIRARWLECIKPSVMIVEEAAEILESQLVAVIPSLVQHLIMIGDHQQLRPQVHYDILCRKCNFHISMFERLIRGGLDYAQLNKQGRMNDELAQLVRELGIYKEYETRKKKGHEVISCLSKSVFFYNHTKEEKTQHSSHSMYNEHEADEVVKLAKYLVCDNNVDTHRVTILCSYRGQVQCIGRKLKERDAYRLSDIMVTTIDSFQGKENDIILLSLVRSSKKGKIGYLSSLNRICVAVSRARIGLYLFGNAYLLKLRSSKGWQKIIDFIAERNCFGKNIDEIFKKGAAIADGPSPGYGVSQQEVQTNKGVTSNIRENRGVVIIGNNNTLNIYHPVDHSSPLQQQSVSAGSQRENEQSQEREKMQSVEETSKHDTLSTTGERDLDLPSEEQQEAQELSWNEPHLSAETQLDSGSRHPLEACEENRPVQDTYLPKRETVQEEDKEDEKNPSVEETSNNNKGQMVLGVECGDVPQDSSSGDVKANFNNVEDEKSPSVEETSKDGFGDAN